MEPYIYSLDPINCPVNKFYHVIGLVNHLDESTGAMKIYADNTIRRIQIKACSIPTD